MPTNVTVRTKIRVNGQEYASVDEMPPEIRQAYERALARMNGGASGTPSGAVRSKVVFNGQTYAGVEGMPADVRRVYEAVMATVDGNGSGAGQVLEASGRSGGLLRVPGGAGTTADLAAGAPRAESTTPRLLIAGAIGLALLLASYLFAR